MAKGSASDLRASLLNLDAALITVLPNTVIADHLFITRNSVNKFAIIVGSGGNESSLCITSAPSNALSYPS